MRFADCRKLKIFHSPLKDLNALHNPACGGQFARLRRASRAPGLFLCPTAHARGFFQVWALRRAPVFPGRKKPDPCSLWPGGNPRLRRASRAPCLCLHSTAHARSCFRVCARAELLFSQAGRKPRRIPHAQKRPKSWSFAPLAFWAFPLSAGGLRPEGPLSRPAARKRGRSAKGRRRSPYAQKRLKS